MIKSNLKRVTLGIIVRTIKIKSTVMKQLFTLLFCLFTTVLFAQLAPNQNPNYEISRSKYMAAKDSLLVSQSTTVQNTYKAYDWMQLRQERKDIRFENRQQRRLNRSMYSGYYDYNNSYYPYSNYNRNYSSRYYSNSNYLNGYNPYRSNYNYRYRGSFADVIWWLFF